MREDKNNPNKVVNELRITGKDKKKVISSASHQIQVKSQDSNLVRL